MNEKIPSDKQFDVTESHEATEAVATDIDAKPEVKREHMESKLRKLGYMALTAAGTYGAFKLGYLDQVPIAADGPAGWVSGSVSAASLTGATHSLYHSFRKK